MAICHRAKTADTAPNMNMTYAEHSQLVSHKPLLKAHLEAQWGLAKIMGVFASSVGVCVCVCV